MNRRQVLCSLFVPLFLFGQDPISPPKPPKPQFFAGLVIEVDTEHVKVTRNLVGRLPETHVFALDPKTKTPKGGVKAKSRVTVRYEHYDDRDLALEIQVRQSTHNPKAT